MGDYYDDYYGGVDEVTFQMHGYGGFGYDTSGVKPDQKESILVTAARNGNLHLIQHALQKESDPLKRLVLLNGARRWTEVDYKMSGFSQEHEWFDLTPLATAAYNGHADIVEYLLKQGADPTLQGCPDEDIYYNAYQAADEGLKESIQNVQDLLSGERYISHSLQSLVMKNRSAEECAQRLLEAQEARQLSLDMLEACKPFWKQASYASSSYGQSREKSGYSNTSTDMNAMVRALDEAKDKYESKRTVADDARHVELVSKISSFRAMMKKSNKRSKESNKKSKKKRKRTRHH